MPFNKRTVEPINLCQVQLPKGIQNELECVANLTLANIIRQLSSLSSLAQDMFDELTTDAIHIFQRTEALHGRIERLKIKVTQLDSNVEEVTIEDVNNRKPFVSVTRIDQQIVNRSTMPKSLRMLYDKAEPAPALHLLNPFRDDGRDCMKFYTDPSFFFNLWMQSMMQFPQNTRPQRQERFRSPKAINKQQQPSLNDTIYISSSSYLRSPDEQSSYHSPHELGLHVLPNKDFEQIARATVQAQYQQQQQSIYSASPSNNRMLSIMKHSNQFNPNEFYEDSRSPKLNGVYRDRQQQQVIMMNGNSNNNSYYSTKSPVIQAVVRQQSPQFDVHQSPYLMDSSMQQPPVMRAPPAIPQQHPVHKQMTAMPFSRPSMISRPSCSPPPPPPPPPPIEQIDTSILGAISETDNLPPPPDDFIHHHQQDDTQNFDKKRLQMEEQYMPPKSPQGSSLPVPPAPPFPSVLHGLVVNVSGRPNPNTSQQQQKTTDNVQALTTQFDEISIASESSVGIQDPRPVVMRDLHSDLLEAIKNGIHLRKTEVRKRKEEEKKKETSGLDVQSIMEMAAKFRRDKIRPQSDSENEDDSTHWDSEG
ncbi:unnamed protein product [Didymodactylos carnosus]|uniref:Wiskott-Aldrich syndrome protein family member n=1 Tax=Didymodactylos carnosus TaxID=1234261 RepID=A0A813WH45_9BILA|nr:unnamed protein product [Didymodactylos carnosus]CAF0950082.1 unnamed protein product [Didymodactylos carnosus]CAF3641162.1 unnamed protein product [Didymodactylos carnosus]CAF3724354.1 unnamed protein product [Didymodactylos carnosus]